MRRFEKHTDVTNRSILEALSQTDKGASAKQTTFVLTEGGPVDTKSARYEYVRTKMNQLAEDGDLEKEKDGRSYKFTITEQGLDRINEDHETPTETESLPALVMTEARDAIGVVLGSGDDDLTVRWEEESGETIETDKVDRDEVEPVESRSDFFERRKKPVPREATSPAGWRAPAEADDSDQNELDDLIEQAEGDGMDLDVPDEPTTSVGGKYERKVPEEKKKEKKEAPTHFPDNGERRVMNRFLTSGEACDGSRIIISEDPLEDGLVDSEDEFKARATRAQCPHCSRTFGVDITKSGTARMRTHTIPKRKSSPRSPYKDYDEEEGRWVEVDPSE